jgi:sugar/nucleoside kinase (ribokinase family)
MRRDLDALVAGYLCVDLAPGFVGGTAGPVDKLFRPGKLIEVGSLGITLGGAVPNTGLALQRFGRKVALNGLVGNDRLGDLVRQLLEGYGVASGIGRTDAAETAYGIVLAPPGVDRMFLECTGANRLFGADDIDAAVLRRSRIFHLGYPPLMERLYADDGAELERVLRQARACGAVTSVDMALPDPDGPAGNVDWPRILARCLPAVDIFVPSVEEILFMLDRDRYAALLAAAGGGDLLGQAPDTLYPELADALLRMGPSVVLIKGGARGLHLAAGDVSGLGELALSARDWNGRARWFDAAPEDAGRIVNACGAGDAAIAGFLAALLDGASMEAAGRLANIAGRDSLYGGNTLDGLRDWAVMRREADAVARHE